MYIHLNVYPRVHGVSWVSYYVVSKSSTGLEMYTCILTVAPSSEASVHLAASIVVTVSTDVGISVEVTVSVDEAVVSKGP